MRKTLIGAATCLLPLLLLTLIGFAGTASAQETPTPTVEATTVDPTPTVEATTADPTPTVEATTADPTPTVEATTADPTPTVEATTVDPTPTVAATTADPTPTGQGDGDIGASFEETNPNPQPGAPLVTPTPDPAAGTAESSGADEVLGQNQLAFTGPDTRIIALGLVLLGAGASVTVVGRRRWN